MFLKTVVTAVGKIVPAFRMSIQNFDRNSIQPGIGDKSLTAQIDVVNVRFRDEDCKPPVTMVDEVSRRNGSPFRGIYLNRVNSDSGQFLN